MSALKIAKFLEGLNSAVKRVVFGVTRISMLSAAKKRLLLNSTLSFVLDCSNDKRRLVFAKRFLNNLEAFGLGWSWGGCKSLAAPVALAHRAAPDFGGSVVRSAHRFDSLDDLMWDLEKAFKALKHAHAV